MIYKSIFTYKEIFDIIFIVNLILSILNVSQKDMKNIKIGQIIISFIKGLKVLQNYYVKNMKQKSKIFSNNLKLKIEDI